MLEMQLDISDFEDIMNLYIEVLKNDLYYVHRFPNKEEREKKMREICSEPIKHLLRYYNGETIGIFEDRQKCDDGTYRKGKLVAFILPFVYRIPSLDDKSTFIIELRDMFLGEDNFIYKQLIECTPFVSYILAIVEHPDYKDMKLGFKLIQDKIQEYPNWIYATDTTNLDYIKWFKENKFIIKEWDDGIKNHILAIHPSKEGVF